ncbi:MAG: LLM class flavin-dependent oxidoreductase [Thiotrichales bacterium]|nr:LLM class flavin-dependent oxidoreductase [Thiotrichales bacterium]
MSRQTASKMHIGIMLHMTPEHNESPVEAYQNFTRLVQVAEELGMEEAWVTEHHFNAHSLAPSPLMLMAHFLASTQRMRFGSAAVLIGFHNPLSIAEQLATLSTLYPNRVVAGFAKGGPFEAQNTAFNMNGELGRSRMEEAVPALLKLFNTENTSHYGERYQWQNIDLQPKTRLGSEHFYLATAKETSIRLAAELELGLMSAQFWSLEKIQNTIMLYRQHHRKSHKPNMMVSRGLYIAENINTAKDIAWQHIQAVRAHKHQLFDKKAGPMTKLSEEELMENTLLGTPEDIFCKLEKLHELGVTNLALNPLTAKHSERTYQIKQFMHDIWEGFTAKHFNADRAESLTS